MSFRSLVVDAGHTRVKLAACEQVEPHLLPQPLQSTAALYGASLDWDLVGSWFTDGNPDAVVVTGTNLKRAEELVSNWPERLPKPKLLNDKSLVPLSVDVDFPEKVGMDRLLNSVAANVLRPADRPAITVDTGTAITVDVVDEGGTFRGGAILPGILLGAKSLHEETTTLPHVNVWELLKREPPVLGRNTEEAIASGLYWGHLGAVREIVERLGQPFRTDGKEPLLLLTGGASVILAPYLPAAERLPDLSLQGLAVVARHLVQIEESL